MKESGPYSNFQKQQHCQNRQKSTQLLKEYYLNPASYLHCM